LSKDAFDRTWIENVEKELQNQLTQGELREGFELCGEKIVLTNFRGKIKSHPNMADAPPSSLLDLKRVQLC
jgi:hypothetical protein